MDNNQRIAEIEKRAQTATKGPWEVEKYYHDEPYDEYIKSAAIIVHKDESNYTITRNDWSNPLEADLNFIAHAREDIPYLLAQLTESQCRERALLRDLSTYKDCGFCAHLQDQQYCYKNCQRHVDVDNLRTHPCWQWRGDSGEGKRNES